MALPPEDFKDLIETIRSTGTAEQKTVASATIALRLMRASLTGSTTLDTATFDANLRSLVASVRTVVGDSTL